MERFSIFLTNFRTQIVDVWDAQNAIKKAIFVGLMVILLGFLVVILSVHNKEDISYLYTDLSQEDTQAISEELKKLGHSNFTIDSKGIRVNSDRVVPLRLQLAQSGLPANGQIGWEKFDQQDFTRTDFEQNIHKLRAIQGELSRTIKSIEGVISARVHLVVPKQSLFIEESKDPTAAIYIKTRQGVTLTPKQINGIVHLTSRSVEGLNPEKVTIIDHQGKMLTQIQTDDPTSKRTEEMLNFRRNIEKSLEEKIRIIVGRIVGPDRVEAKVDVDVDFTTEEQTISDIDPDKVVVLASNTTTQEMSGNGLNPTGIPGAKSNVPGEQEELTVNSNRANSSRSSERLNYEISKRNSHKVLPVGDIKRISIAVIVDGAQAYSKDGAQPIFQARSAEEMQKIEELVKSTVGFKEGRDEVKVHNMLFQLSPYQLEAIKETTQENRNYIMTIAVSGAIAVALVFFFAFIVRPYFRWLSYDPERKKREALVEEFKPDLELGSVQNVQVKEDIPFEKLTPQEQILFLAKHEPARTTEGLRMMLSPHSSNS